MTVKRSGGVSFKRVTTYEDSDLIEGLYLPYEPLQCRVTYLKAPKGTGKTQVITRCLCDALDPVYVLSHRRSLARNISRRMNLANYEQSKGLITGSAVVVVDSLCRVETKIRTRYDATLKEIGMVVIDESEQLFRHLYGGTIKGKSLSVFNKLRELLQAAKRIVVADADLSGFTVDFIRDLLGWDEDSADRDEEFRQANPQLPWRYTYTTDKTRFELSMLSAIKNRERLVIADFSVKHAETLAKMIELRHPELAVGLVTAATTTALKTELEDVNKWAGELDVLIYTPSLGTGVSIDLKQHFDRIFGAFFMGVGTAQDAHQMLHRVRNPRSNEIMVYLPPQCVALTQNEAVLSETILSMAMETESAVHDDDQTPLVLGETVVESDGKVRLRPYSKLHFDWYIRTLIYERRHGGKGGALLWAFPEYLESLNLKHPPINLGETELTPEEEASLDAAREERSDLAREAKRLTKEAYAKEIAGADVISISEVGFITEPKDKAQRNAIERARIFDFYGNATLETVLEDNWGRLRKKGWDYCELRALLDGRRNLLAALDRGDVNRRDISQLKHRLQRAKMRMTILHKFGFDGLDRSHVVKKEDLRDVVRWAKRNRKKLSELGFSVPSKMRDNPIQFLSLALQKVGLRLDKTRSRDPSNKTKFIRQYRLSAAAIARMDRVTAVAYPRFVEDIERLIARRNNPFDVFRR